jgi:hypothetical protein
LCLILKEKILVFTFEYNGVGFGHMALIMLR